MIAGGESGPRARPSHPEWFRELRDSVIFARKEARVGGKLVYRSDPAFFFKQWGEWAPPPLERGIHPGDLFWSLEADGFEERYVVPRDYVCAPNESIATHIARVGKRNAGREIDGRTWDEFPASATVPA